MARTVVREGGAKAPPLLAPRLWMSSGETRGLSDMSRALMLLPWETQGYSIADESDNVMGEVAAFLPPRARVISA